MEHMERWVQETFAPLVLTCTTPEVERIAQKNGLAFAELLNAFSMIAQADAPLRSVNHQFTLAGFNFKFVAATQFGTLGLQDASRLLNEEIARHPPRNASGGQSTIDLDIPKIVSVDDVPVYLRAIGVAPDSTATAPNTDPLPWYREFKRTLLDTFRCEEYSMLCQPAAMLLAVSSTDGNPRHCFGELAAIRNLPPAFLNGLYDPSIPKFYVVVHDNAEADGTSIDPEAILLSLQLPPHASTVLRLNSFATERPDAREHARRWTEHPYVRRPLFTSSASNDVLAPDYVGSVLSNDDVLRMTAFVRDVGLRFVLAALEARIFQLNEIVSAMKKGVKNVFKSWLRKPKDLSARTLSSSGNGSASVTYRCDSIEAQTRLLGDTAFMVRDYDLALQMYRLVRDDYKSDKSTLHCANANEMIALCLLLTKGSPMQMTNALESATAIYVKGNSLVTARLAVRAAVVAGEIYNTLSHSGLFTDYMDSASAALIRGSTMEQGICSAVLMERAALCDIQSRQPKFRKYGFRMVMAGHVYDSLGHRAHSARCYALARAIYDASGWFQVEDHINFTLAQQANRLSDPIASINLFLKLIGTGRNSASQQEALLYEFGLIVKEFLATSGSKDSDGASAPATLSRNGPMLLTDKTLGTKTLVVKNLCMPELDDTSTVVFAPGNACGINREIDGNATDAEHWRALEQTIAKQNQIHQFASNSADANASNRDGSANRWLHQPSTFNVTFRNKKQQVKKPENYALGEPIYVEFVMKNALSCAVDVEDIHLFGKFESAASGSTSSDSDAVIDVPESRAHGDSDDAHITVGRVNLQLLPCSEERVRLAVTPHVRGVLRLIGVRWSICGGDVHGEHAFDIPGPLLQDTRANREARARAPNTSLIANVIGAMPWLGVQVENAPTDAYVGEIVKMDVTLVNGGTAELADLQLCCSDLLLCVASDSRAAATQLAPYVGASGHVLDLSDVRLAPGESKRIAVWARGVVPGRLRARLVFRYRNANEVATATPTLLPHRTVRIALELNLLPCVSVSYAVAPSYGSSGEYILGVTVQNERRDGSGEQHDPVRLEQLLCVSSAWTIERFPSPGADGVDPGRPSPVRDSTQLGFQEASTSYFRIVPRTAPATTDDAPLSHSTSTLELAPQSLSSAAEQLSDLPVEQFLCIENAQGLVREAAQAGADGSGSGSDGKRNSGGGGFRTIQSVRRENKALKNQQTEEQAVDDEEARRRASPQPTSRAALLSSPDVDGHLVLVWSTETSVRRRAIGQANVTPIKVRAPLRPNACPLNVTLEYADSIVLKAAGASGSSGVPGVSFAELDIVMTIRNDCAATSAPIDCTLEMLHPSESKASSGSYPFAGVSAITASPHFFWAGVTKKTILDLAPNAHETIRLRACFLSAGIYDLNRFRFRIHSRQVAGNSAKALTPTVIELPVEYLVYVKPALSVTPSLALNSSATHSVSELAA